MPSERKFISPKTANCIARGPNLSALRMPLQFCTGCGSLQRNLSTGGAAKGTPLNVFIPDSFTPSSSPFAIFTCGASPFSCAVATETVIVNNKRKKKFLFISFLLVYSMSVLKRFLLGFHFIDLCLRNKNLVIFFGNNFFGEIKCCCL